MPKKVSKQTKPTIPTAREIFKGVKLLELNPRGQYLFVINQQQFNQSSVAELINLFDKTGMSNVKGALLVQGDVNTALNVIDAEKLKKQEPKNAKNHTA